MDYGVVSDSFLVLNEPSSRICYLPIILLPVAYTFMNAVRKLSFGKLL